jgi:peptide/nickel transport system permease protein
LWLALLRSLAAIVGVTVAVFFIIRIVPGDPAKMILGEHSTPQAVEAMRARLGLDLPLGEQFLRFVRGFFAGDAGDSIFYGTPSRSLIASRAPVTLLLIALSGFLALGFSLALALLAATHKDGPLDHVIRILPAITLGMPVFWAGLLLILIFGVWLRWFPVGGIGEGPAGVLHSLTLPATAVAFSQIPVLVRSLRVQLLEALESDFVVTLKAAGIPFRVILIKHVLRNAALPTLMLFGVNLSYLAGGTLVVEQVFGIRGIGSLLFSAIANRDFPLIQGIAVYCGASVVVISFLIDTFARRLDPRIREGR